MNDTTDSTTPPTEGRTGRAAGRIALFVGVAGLVALSAVVTKEAVNRSALRPLADVNDAANVSERASTVNVGLASVVEVPKADAPAFRPAQSHEPTIDAEPAAQAVEDSMGFGASPDVRYFNGRPVRAARTIRMVVTAYSPDEKSCAPFADGLTSSLHQVGTNAMKLVAADSRVLPLGSMVSVPGYDEGRIVPVLDRGGAIKGKKLDVLFPTDAAAMRWGVKTLDVVVWEYADNLPADDFRAIRDSRTR